VSSALFRADALSGQVAFVTGGAAGIGAAIVHQLSEAGAKVIFADRDEASGAAIADQTRSDFVKLDLSDLAAVSKIVSDCKRIDIVINNAGVDQHAFFTDTSPSDWQMLLRINLEAVFAVTHAALPTMQASGYGRIVNISSEAGRQGSKGGAVYAAAKGGVLAFTKSLARENARFGITANAVCPGPVQTPLLDAAIAGENGDKLEQAMRNATLLRRLGTPQEVATAVTYLASPAAGFITGEVLGVSGGMGC
jgi:2-hydroxycyclohexanecarboxyl-CoA dehydrogenase